MALPLGILGLVWGGALWMGLRRPWARVAEIIVLLACVALLGPAAMGLFIVTVCTAAMSLRLLPAMGMSTITTAGVFVMVLLGPQGGGARRSNMPPFMVAVPAVVLFAIGRTVRYSVLTQITAQEQAATLSQTNALLANSLRASGELATARERGRIARELHDSLGHCLTAAHVQVQLAARAVEARSDSAGDALEKVSDAVLGGIHELRRCVAVMRDPRTDEPLGEVMRALVDALPQDGLVIRLTVDGPERTLAPEREFVLFRALQEALTNVTKHASAENVHVRLAYTSVGRVRLEVRDDGVGSEAVAAGFGLNGLAQRVEAFGGDLAIATAPGAGFRLAVELEGAA